MLSSTAPKSHLHLLTRTGPVHLDHHDTTPTGLHLALSESVDEMRVHFTTGTNNRSTPVVEYGLHQAGLRSSQTLSQRGGTSSTYQASELCGAPANVEEPGKFVDPGTTHVVGMTGLLPDTEYWYRVGVEVSTDVKTVWSTRRVFRSAPLPGVTNNDFSFLVFGDQGFETNVHKKHHPAKGGLKIAHHVADEVRRGFTATTPIRAVHHVGDLSYAEGAGHVWDQWLGMIEPYASRVPLMIAIGNHEYDYGTTGGDDHQDPSGVSAAYRGPRGRYDDNASGGECAVPVVKRFRMPASDGSNGVFWYSYDHGPTHVIVLSSEHDCRPTSKQYQWLEADLTRVNRTITPWLLVESHRPMYDLGSKARPASTQRRRLQRKQLHTYPYESLLQEHRVDLFLAGHVHAYARFCQGLYGRQCHHPGSSMQHITVGTGGAKLAKKRPYTRPWVEKYLVQWGYGRVTITDEGRALHWEFVSEEGKVADEVWLYKNNTVADEVRPYDHRTVAVA